MLFLGCDGGSTKTEWLLVNEHGDICSHQKTEGCNYAFLGREGFNALMQRSIELLVKEANIERTDIDGAMFSITAFGELPGTEENIPGDLSAMLPGVRHLMIENDSVAAWGGSLAGKPGINLVSGTGSIAYGRDEKRQGKRVGGWSLFFGDEGSCSWIGRQLANRFMREADGRAEKTAVYDMVRQEMHLAKDQYLTEFLQSRVRQDSSLLASMQRIALMLARMGDNTALTLYQQAAEELAAMARAVRNALSFENQPVKVSYSGGLFHAGEYIMNPFQQAMQRDGFSLQKPEYSPIIGAVLLACEEKLNENEKQILLEQLSKNLEK